MPRIQLSALSFRHMSSPADTKLHFTTNSWKVSRLWCFTNYVFGRTYRKDLVLQLFEKIALHAFEMYYKVHRGQFLNAHCVFCDDIPTNRPILSMYHEKTDNWLHTILTLLKKKFTQKKNICWKYTHGQAIQDVDEFVSSSDLETCSITSLVTVNGCRQNESPNSW